MGLFNSVKTPDNTTHTVSLPYGYCETAAGTAAKTVTVPNVSELTTGLAIIVRFKNSNSASSPTLNVNGLGAKNIYRYGTTKASTSTTVSGWTAGAVQLFVYNGSGWVRDYWSNTTYTNAALGQGFAICNTAAADAAKVCSISSYAFATGGIVAIQFTNGNTASNPTLNITEKGAKPIYYNGAAIDDDTFIQAGDICTFMYDSTSDAYHLLANDRWYKDIQTLAEDKMDKTNPTGTGTFSMNGANATGTGAFAIGHGTIAAGNNSHAEGEETTASGDASHAEGYAYNTSLSLTGSANSTSYTVSKKNGGIKIGRVLKYNNTYTKITNYDSSTLTITTDTTLSSTALSEASVELLSGVASGKYSHAEGKQTTASGNNSHAEGAGTIASGNNSHAEGAGTIASGRNSHAEGLNTIASGTNSHVQGKLNIEDTEDAYAHIVGNGESPSSRSNAHTLDWYGNAWFAGKIKIGGTGQDDPNAKKLATVDDIPQSDWNQNDENADDYIKNRPFYTGEPVETFIVEETTVTLEEDSGPIGLLTASQPLEVGQEYSVTIDGVQYNAVCKNANINGMNMPYLGNANIAVGGEDTGETFFIAPMASSETELGVMNTTGTLEYTVSVTYMQSEIHHIDPKYIKDMYYKEVYNVEPLPQSSLLFETGIFDDILLPTPLIAGSSYTVNLNGVEYVCTAKSYEENQAYIENKDVPFSIKTWAEGEDCYTYMETPGTGSFNISIYNNTDSVEVLPETSVEIEDYNISRYDVLTEMLVEGSEYTVNWDGIEYKCIAKSTEWGDIYVGNPGINGDESSESNEPFYITSSSDGYNSIMPAEEGTHDVHITGVVTKYHTIDRQYLPVLVGASGTGENSEIFNDYRNNVASGSYSHAEGYRTTASGQSSHAEGWLTTASGIESHVEGCNTIASGDYSHAEGMWTTASGDYSHAEGQSTTASGDYSHAEGSETKASGNGSHAEGQGKSISLSLTGNANSTSYKVSSNNDNIEIGRVLKYNDIYAKITNYDSSTLTITTDKTLSSTALSNARVKLVLGIAFGTYSHAEGLNTTASGNYGSHVEGYNTIASGDFSHAEGQSTTASGYASHAEGSGTKATKTDDTILITTITDKGYYTHAEGYGTVAYGAVSHAEGNATKASGSYSHSEGQLTTASGKGSHAEGLRTIASGSNSHAEGGDTKATGKYSHAEGEDTEATASASHAGGCGTIASGDDQTVIGRYNIADTQNTYGFIVGNGTAFNNAFRKNAFTVDWSGNGVFAGGVTATSFNGYTIGKSVPSDAKFTDTTYSAATTSAAGLMTADMVTKLNGIATGANKYSLPAATSSALGGVKIGSNISVSSGTISLTKSNVTSALGYTPTKKEFIFDTYSKSVTINPGDQSVTVGALTQRSGYTLLGYINQNGGYTDQWLISYGTYGSNVVAMVHSKYSGALTQTISCTAIWYKNQ